MVPRARARGWSARTAPDAASTGRSTYRRRRVRRSDGRPHGRQLCSCPAAPASCGAVVAASEPVPRGRRLALHIRLPRLDLRLGLLADLSPRESVAPPASTPSRSPRRSPWSPASGASRRSRGSSCRSPRSPAGSPGTDQDRHHPAEDFLDLRDHPPRRRGRCRSPSRGSCSRTPRSAARSPRRTSPRRRSACRLDERRRGVEQPISHVMPAVMIRLTTNSFAFSRIMSLMSPTFSTIICQIPPTPPSPGGRTRRPSAP